MAMDKTLAEIKKQYITITPQRQAQYTEGVTNPGKDWHNETVAAEARWSAAMVDPATLQRHKDAVENTPTDVWQKAAVKNAPRWGQGVAGAGDAYAAGYAPYQQGWSEDKLAPKAGKRDIPGMTARIMSNNKQFMDIKDAQQ